MNWNNPYCRITNASTILLLLFSLKTIIQGSSVAQNIHLNEEVFLYIVS